MRKDLDDHLTKDCPNRAYKCHYCGEEGTFAAITEIHDKTCGKKIIVPCHNAERTGTMQRRVADKHVMFEYDCTVIPCKYESIGCGVKMKRRDMPAHEQDNKVHLHMTLETTLQLKKDNKTLKSDNEKLKSDVAELRRDLCSAINILQLTLKAEPQTYKLTDYQKKKDKREAFTFAPFYSHPRGYHLALEVDVNGDSSGEGTHVTLWALIVKGDYDTKLKWPFLGKVTITLLNQLEDKDHHTKVVSLTSKEDARVGDIWGYPKFTPHSALGHDPDKNTQYLKDNTLYFRVSVDVYSTVITSRMNF